MEEKRRESNRREGRKGGKKEKERKYDQNKEDYHLKINSSVCRKKKDLYQ